MTWSASDASGHRVGDKGGLNRAEVLAHVFEGLWRRLHRAQRLLSVGDPRVGDEENARMNAQRAEVNDVVPRAVQHVQLGKRSVELGASLC